MEICREYYLRHGRKMLEDNFPDILDKIAVGLCGSGSECFGFDDEISTDHDFQPGFIIFLPNEDIINFRTEFQLEKAYAQLLPDEFLGLKRSNLSPVGGSRHGVHRVSEFLMEKTGTHDGNLSTRQWLNIPEEFLAEAVNGQIFDDPADIITSAREKLSQMPEDIRLKRLAGVIMVMAQSGQYNYSRCLAHGEKEAAQLCINRFCEAAMKAVFLLNRRYMPFYKWSFKALRMLEKLNYIADYLYYLMTSGNDEKEAARKTEMIEAISLLIIDELKQQKLTDVSDNDLESHAYSINKKISDPQIRNLSVLYTV